MQVVGDDPLPKDRSALYAVIPHGTFPFGLGVVRVLKATPAICPPQLAGRGLLMSRTSSPLRVCPIQVSLGPLNKLFNKVRPVVASAVLRFPVGDCDEDDRGRKKEGVNPDLNDRALGVT